MQVSPEFHTTLESLLSKLLDLEEVVMTLPRYQRPVLPKLQPKVFGKRFSSGEWSLLREGCSVELDDDLRVRISWQRSVSLYDTSGNRFCYFFNESESLSEAVLLLWMVVFCLDYILQYKSEQGCVRFGTEFLHKEFAKNWHRLKRPNS